MPLNDSKQPPNPHKKMSECKFHPDEIVMFKSPHMDEAQEVSYRGPYGVNEACIWTGRLQMMVSNDWLSKKVTTPPPIHPLAKEAAERILEAAKFMGKEGLNPCEIQRIIHSTAIEPILKAGEELWEEFRDFAGQNKCGCGHPTCSRCRDDCYVAKALAQWRTLTSPAKGDSTTGQTKDKTP